MVRGNHPFYCSRLTLFRKPSINNNMKMKLMLFLLTFSLTTSIQADEEMQDEARDVPSAEAMIVDGLVYRPLSLAGTIVGTGLFILTLPFSAIGGNADEAGQRLVVEPAQSTFDRCLGCLPDNSRVNR